MFFGGYFCDRTQQLPRMNIDLLIENLRNPALLFFVLGIVSVSVKSDLSDRFVLAVLGASASYIAVPAAMKMAVPKANPGLYLPMALAVTFPVNITVGLPIFFAIIG